MFIYMKINMYTKPSGKNKLFLKTTYSCTKDFAREI